MDCYSFKNELFFVGNVARCVKLCFLQSVLKKKFIFKLLVKTLVKVGGNGFGSEGTYPTTALFNLLAVKGCLCVIIGKRKCGSNWTRVFK